MGFKLNEDTACSKRYWFLLSSIDNRCKKWRSFIHVAIDHQPLIALEQWKAFRHQLLWVAVKNSKHRTMWMDVCYRDVC